MPLPNLSNFLTNLQTNNYSPETVYNYTRDLNTFSIFLSTNNIKFNNLNKQLINEYKFYLNSKLNCSSINRHLSTLRSYLKYLIEMDQPTPISPEMVKLVKTERRHPHVATLIELTKLIEAPTTNESNPIIITRNRAILELLFSTGMRISELINLNKNQIDQTGRIFIKGKGKKERFVYLTKRANHYLTTYLKSNDHPDTQALFTSLTGKKRLSANYLQERIKYYREKLNIIIPISAHSLRHGFATYLAEEGANPAAIQILLGHESLDTTTRYVHASDRYAEKTHLDFHPLKNF